MNCDHHREVQSALHLITTNDHRSIDLVINEKLISHIIIILVVFSNLIRRIAIAPNPRTTHKVHGRRDLRNPRVIFHQVPKGFLCPAIVIKLNYAFIIRFWCFLFIYHLFIFYNSLLNSKFSQHFFSSWLINSIKLYISFLPSFVRYFFVFSQKKEDECVDSLPRYGSQQYAYLF